MSNTCLIITPVVIVLGMSTTRTNENKRQLRLKLAVRTTRAPRNDVNTNVFLHQMLKGRSCNSILFKLHISGEHMFIRKTTNKQLIDN